MCRLPCKRWIRQSSSSPTRRLWRCTNPRYHYCKAIRCRPWSWHARPTSATLTLLPAYLALGKAALANTQYAEAIQVLKTYVDYAANDADGWMVLAQAYAGLSQPDEAYVEPSRKPDEQDYEAALEAFDRAIELNEELPELYLYRGLLYLAAGEGQPAVNDFVNARRLDSKSFATNLALGRVLCWWRGGPRRLTTRSTAAMTWRSPTSSWPPCTTGAPWRVRNCAWMPR